MDVLVFKTDLRTKSQLRAVSPIFKHLPVQKWTVDTEDIDKVLRIEAIGQLTETDVISRIKKKGFYCEALTD